MKWTIGFLATLAVLAALPTPAEAQRHRGNGTVNTPFGQFNMNDMRAAGGDPFMAEELREQKMALQYQQSLMRQHQQYMQQLAKQQKAKQDSLKKNPATAKSETVSAATTPSTDQPKGKNAASGSAKAPGKTSKTSKAGTDSSSTSKVPGAPPNSTRSK